MWKRHQFSFQSIFIGSEFRHVVNTTFFFIIIIIFISPPHNSLVHTSPNVFTVYPEINFANDEMIMIMCEFE